MRCKHCNREIISIDVYWKVESGYPSPRGDTRWFYQCSGNMQGRPTNNHEPMEKEDLFDTLYKKMTV